MVLALQGTCTKAPNGLKLIDDKKKKNLFEIIKEKKNLEIIFKKYQRKKTPKHQKIK